MSSWHGPLAGLLMSALGQKQTSAFQTDHLAVTAERRNAHREIAISALAWPNGTMSCTLPITLYWAF